MAPARSNLKVLTHNSTPPPIFKEKYRLSIGNVSRETLPIERLLIATNQLNVEARRWLLRKILNLRLGTFLSCSTD